MPAAQLEPPATVLRHIGCLVRRDAVLSSSRLLDRYPACRYRELLAAAVQDFSSSARVQAELAGGSGAALLHLLDRLPQEVRWAGTGLST